MRKAVQKELRRQFRKAIIASFSTFAPLNNYKGLPGSDVYMWNVTPNFNAFICLLPNAKAYNDSFMVELGWSSSGFPERAPLQHKQRLEPMKDGRIRLPQLWREKWGSAMEPWWNAGNSLTLDNMEQFYSEEEMRRRVEAIPDLVRDAVVKIREHAIPFFQQIAATRGQL